MGLLLVMLFLALTLGLFLAPGVGLVALVPLALAVVSAVWLLRRNPPSRAIRRTRHQPLLGPGGPDDPDRARDGSALRISPVGRRRRGMSTVAPGSATPAPAFPAPARRPKSAPSLRGHMDAGRQGRAAGKQAQRRDRGDAPVPPRRPRTVWSTRRRSRPRRKTRSDRILLVVTTDPDGSALTALPDLSGKDVRVVAPLARLSRVDWLTNDDRTERGAAEARAEDVAREVAPDARRDVGTDDVLLAVEDELRVFDADEIWLVTAPSSEESWLEAGLHGSGLARFGRPVRRAVTGRDRA